MSVEQIAESCLEVRRGILNIVLSSNYVRKFGVNNGPLWRDGQSGNLGLHNPVLVKRPLPASRLASNMLTDHACTSYWHAFVSDGWRPIPADRTWKGYRTCALSIVNPLQTFPMTRRLLMQWWLHLLDTSTLRLPKIKTMEVVFVSTTYWLSLLLEANKNKKDRAYMILC